MIETKINYRYHYILVIIVSFSVTLTLASSCNLTQGGQPIKISGKPPFNDSCTINTVSQNNLLSINFTIINGTYLTTTSLITKLNNTIEYQSIDRSDFYHQNPVKIINYDLDAMWQARTHQFININLSQSSAYQLNMAVANFNPWYRPVNSSQKFQITITLKNPPSYECQQCLSGSISSQQSCICQNCLSQTTGQICSRTILQLKNNQTFLLQKQKLMYFYLPNTKNIIIQTTTTNGCLVQMYYQFQQFNNQVANFYNVAITNNDNSDGTFHIGGNDKISINAETQSRTLLITLVNFEPGPCYPHISFNEKYQINILVIIISVLGSILLISLAIAIICLIKCRMIANMRINSQISSISNELTANQIQKYFPQCMFNKIVDNKSLIVPSSIVLDDSNIQHLSNTNITQMQNQNYDFDCVICLETINLEDMVRICYCKHIFHSSCLIGWFNKQRICPYCRKSYHKHQTQLQYKKLIHENDDKVVTKTQLARMIFNRRTSKVQVESIDD